ncbi:MAG: hypothetical protein IKO26_10725 [Paludibacteraceae bacterium]|nr:hypothetical protein [Paludibacteraceae bacterium]
MVNDQMVNRTAAPFRMPMFRAWVPRKIQPWIYILQVLCIQFSGGVYLGALEAVRGTTALQLEDLLMLLYAGLAGMAVWFPMLFRMKFRFTNQQLLIGSAVVIAVCNLITMRTTNMAVLLPVCFVAGIAKLQGTFENMSNIQLWMTPERDFGVFFPILHIVLLTAITGSAWLAAVIAFHFSWQMMHVLTIGTMCFVVAVQLFLCQPWCPMPQRMPLRGIDISTGLLISLLMLMISYILVYGDRLMWFFSPTLRWVLALSLILLAFIMYRLKTVEKPYISLEIFKYKNVLAILLVTAIAELLLGAEHTLEEIYWTEVRGLEEHTKGALCLWSLPGVYVGVLITLYWLGQKKWKVWKLFAIGFGCILVYSLWMYFYLDVNVPIEQYRLGLAFRGCAYAILAASLMWSLHESVHDLEHFFMALFIFNVIHMYLAGASGYGLYTTLFKHFMADNMSRYGAYMTLTTLDSQLLSTLNSQLSTLSVSVMSVTLKQIYGQVIWVSLFMTSAFLLLDIPRVRTGIEKVPYWPVYGIKFLARLR